MQLWLIELNYYIWFIWLSNQTRVTHICGDVHSNALGGIIITSISDNPMVTNNQRTHHWTHDPTSPFEGKQWHRSNVITTMNTNPSNHEKPQPILPSSLTQDMEAPTTTYSSFISWDQLNMNNLNQFFLHLTRPAPNGHWTTSTSPPAYSSPITGNLIMSSSLGLVCPKVS